MNLTASDKLEVMELAARFEMALDKEDVENYLAIFAEDGSVQGFWGTAIGKEQLQQGFYAMLDTFARGRRHCTTNAIIRGDSSEAIMESYLLVFNREDLLRFGSAFVTDRAVKKDGKWYLASRQVDVDPSFPLLAQFQA
ncbi:nuclear transport factor 2 family protein [Nodosilinea nodulosa]|uniref:nuclear transport factor 2 family protein n=1 Tax=Nodosilinea nodulosa TaxID=416001 RepID=UPI0003076B01|nr:nuclear transport factor 2 family protein [Nodosilinea nodulosa]